MMREPGDPFNNGENEQPQQENWPLEEKGETKPSSDEIRKIIDRNYKEKIDELREFKKQREMEIKKSGQAGDLKKLEKELEEKEMMAAKEYQAALENRGLELTEAQGKLKREKAVKKEELERSKTAEKVAEARKKAGDEMLFKRREQRRDVA